MLRQLREAAGVDAALVASALKVPLQKLQALEADRFEALPDMTFARGLASAICRAFGVDPQPILERMPAVTPGLGQSGPTLHEPFQRTSDGPASMLTSVMTRPLMIAVGVLLLGAALLWLWPTLPIRLTAPETSPAAVGAEEPASMPGAEAPAEPVPAAVPLPPAESEQAAASAAAAASAPASAPEPTSLLGLTATGETWVSVHDASGKVLLNRTLTAGESLALDGAPPLAVTIGRKDAARVTVRGKSFDILALSKGTVARFKVE